MNRSALSLAVFVLAASVALFAGCSNNADNSSQTDGLRSVSVPSDFTFATSRSVALQLSVDGAALATGSGALEVSSPDGRVYFRGPAQPEAPLRLKLAVPTKDSQLAVTLFVNNEPKKALVDIKDGAAAYKFE